MIHGIDGTRFTSNGQDIGGGIVVIDNTSIHGGDSVYLYKGQYWLQDNHRIEAIVNVQNYTGRLNALVGPLSSFELTLSGMAEPKLMRLGVRERTGPPDHSDRPHQDQRSCRWAASMRCASSLQAAIWRLLARSLSKPTGLKVRWRGVGPSTHAETVAIGDLLF